MTKAKPLPSPERVAAEFVSVLRSWLSKHEWQEMVRLNAASESSGICHSHDYCDANQAMLEALERLGVVGQRLWCRGHFRDAASDLMDKAWAIARDKHMGGRSNVRNFVIVGAGPHNRGMFYRRGEYVEQGGAMVPTQGQWVAADARTVFGELARKHFPKPVDGEWKEIERGPAAV